MRPGMPERQREGYLENGVRRRRVYSCATEGGRAGDVGAARRGTPYGQSSMALVQRLSRASGLLMLCVPPLSMSTSAQRRHTPLHRQRSHASIAAAGALIGQRALIAQSFAVLRRPRGSRSCGRFSVYVPVSPFRHASAVFAPTCARGDTLTRACNAPMLPRAGT